MVAKLRRDDGYRGLLRNPETGRTFLANQHTVRRFDLERVDTPDQVAKVETSKPAVPVKKSKRVVEAEVAAVVASNESEAAAAMDAMAVEAENTTDKSELKDIGGRIGLKLSGAMNVDTMKHRIAQQILAISDA